MKIGVASGKGGTGKTTITTCLAYVASQSGRSVTLLDCDVDEPNAHLFLKPEITEQAPVTRPVPHVHMERCTACHACSDFCQYGAIACAGDNVLVFPELCHGCGGCSLVCPADAIREEERPVGRLELGYAGSIRFAHGILNVGEPMSPPVINAVKAAVPDEGLSFIDAPPGTSCPAIETLRACDYVMLVTEPTPFGLNDLKLAVAMVRALGMPCGIVINRAITGNRLIQDYCSEEHLEILGQIPEDRAIAEAYSEGHLIVKSLPKYKALFADILKDLLVHE